MSLVIEKVELDPNKRLLCISDIHGNLEGLEKLLADAKYTKEDQLVVIGDMVEKGPNSLGVVRYLMELQKTNDVYIVQGNCDWSIGYVLDDINEAKEYLDISEGICYDMAKEINIVDDNKTIEEIVELFWNAFSVEINWLKSLPTIIDTQYLTFVHAGIMEKELKSNDYASCLSLRLFEEKAPIFDKYVMVGHYPTASYCEQITDCNPRINNEKKVISIDGGNGVKKEGQLNLVIIDDLDTMNISNIYVDKGIEMIAMYDQKESEVYGSIPWGKHEVIVLEELVDCKYIQQISSGYKMKVGVDDVYIMDDKYYVVDSTDYRLPITKGDILSVHKETASGYLVKKNGILGWYDKK